MISVLFASTRIDTNRLQMRSSIGRNDDIAISGWNRQAVQAGDPAWAAALAEAEATLSAYATALPPIAPPSLAKSELMQRVARQQSFGRPVISSAADAYRTHRIIAQSFAAIAAIVLLAVLVNVWTTRKIDEARKSVAAEMSKELRERDARILILQGEMDRQLKDKDQQLVAYKAAAEHDSRVLAALHSPSLKVFALGSDKSKATGRLLVDQEHQTWHVFATSLAPLPAGKEYELWFITPEKQAIAGGTFNVDASGNAVYTVSLPKGIGPVATAAITDEDAGGVAVAKGQIRLIGNLN